MPLHPFFVHFPIALFVVAGALSAYNVFRKSPHYDTFTLLLLGIGLIFAVGAIITGEIDQESLDRTTALGDVLALHENLGFFTVASFFGLFAWLLMRRRIMDARERYFQVAAYAVAIVIMFYGAYLGGELVYRFGVGVKSSPPERIESNTTDSAGVRRNW